MTRSFIPSHAPYGTTAQAVAQAYFEAWLEHRSRSGRPIPKYVVDEFLKWFACGDPEHGFTVLACPNGHGSRYIANRCKGRSFCTYCLTLRQRDIGERLIERVIGNVPVRHVVLCFPPYLRRVLGYDEALLDGGFSALAKAMFDYQRRKAAELTGVPLGRIHAGCVEGNHRTSADLSVNHHVHGIFPAGVFIEREPGRLEFFRLPLPSDEEVAGVAHAACLAFCEVLRSKGFWETTPSSPSTVEGILSLPGTKRRTAKFFGQAAKDSEGGVAPRDGAYAFHVFVGNAIELEDRPQLEYLVRYILAPPFKDAQVEVNAAGNIVLWLKRNRHDGTASVELKPFQWLDRLADLVSRPNTNCVRYFGIYAPRARLRKLAVALRLEGHLSATHSGRASMTCPVCSAKLRVVAEVKGHRREAAPVPPDTPATPTPRDQDRFDRGTMAPGQGRLFG